MRVREPAAPPALRVAPPLPARPRAGSSAAPPAHRRLLLAVAVLACSSPGCRFFKRSLPADFRRGGLELVYGMESAPAGPAAEQVVFAVRQRIAALALCEPEIKVAGREVTVRLPAACGPGVARIKGLLRVGGRVAIQEIDDGAALPGIADRVPLGAGVALAVDRWTDHAAGVARQARVLEGPAAALERFRASLAPGTLPAGVEALVESRAPGNGSARLYLVRREGGPTRANLYDAKVFTDEPTGRSTVSAEFDLQGTKLLHALTARLHGRKVAIILDGRIVAAPVVVDTLTTGAVRIDLASTTDAQTARLEAQDLAVALRAGVLPRPFTLLREHPIPRAK